MKFKYKDQIITASSKDEAVKKITSDTDMSNNLDSFKTLKNLLDSEVHIDFKLNQKDKNKIYLIGFKDKVEYRIYLSKNGKKIKVSITNVPGITEDAHTSVIFNGTQVGTIKFDELIGDISDYLDRYKENEKFKTRFSKMANLHI